MLTGLPREERDRASRWLTGVWVMLHAGGTGQEVMTTLDSTLNALHRAAAADVRDPGELSRVTITPPAGQAEALRRALEPGLDGCRRAA